MNVVDEDEIIIVNGVNLVELLQNGGLSTQPIEAMEAADGSMMVVSRISLSRGRLLVNGGLSHLRS